MNLGGVEMQADSVNGGVIFIPKVTAPILTQQQLYLKQMDRL